MNSPLRVGLLRTNIKQVWKPQHTACAMMYTAKQFDIELFVFHPDDVDFETKTINGVFLDGNTRIRRRVAFPAIIDNSIVEEKRHEEILTELEKDCIVIRHSLRTTKLRTYNRLLEDGRFKSLLIPTQKLESPSQVIEVLQKHDSIILKPARGGRGSGVRRLSRHADGSYQLTEKDSTQRLEQEPLISFLQALSDKKLYVWQPYIVSRTQSGNPFDIRIHARRGREGKFQVHLFPRIGNARGVVSNISTGGYSMDIDVFLRQEFGEAGSQLKRELVALGAVFPDYYQSFHEPTIFDVGMDVGIQQRNGTYELYLFEVNTYIDGPFFEIEDAITHFDYFRHLQKSMQ